jgi:hypothetical protein
LYSLGAGTEKILNWPIRLDVADNRRTIDGDFIWKERLKVSILVFRDEKKDRKNSLEKFI